MFVFCFCIFPKSILVSAVTLVDLFLSLFCVWCVVRDQLHFWSGGIGHSIALATFPKEIVFLDE